MPKPLRPLEGVWNAAVLVLGIALVLWFAVQLLTQIWGWLVAIGLVAIAGWLVVQLHRRRRDRW